MIKQITAPLTHETIAGLKAGDMVEISGVIYTARDAAHKRMMDLVISNQPLPFNIREQIIYYVGPCPAPEGKVIGSAGPTTSGRMDKYTPKLIEMGLTGMIGKGQRSDEVISAMKQYGAVYFGAVGGAAALISKCIISQEVIAFADLGTEAVRKMVVNRFPVIVVIDQYGNNLYDSGRKKYRVKELNHD
ncbi:MAG: Fe-S-containing hydro-lyase [Clostridiaceae bacterium]|jgi:fumarate hydratase subunit beta|nr:Fe-S-containing hydro-lyase [Clostridiaceae bacterium]